MHCGEPPWSCSDCNGNLKTRLSFNQGPAFSAILLEVEIFFLGSVKISPVSSDFHLLVRLFIHPFVRLISDESEKQLIFTF